MGVGVGGGGEGEGRRREQRRRVASAERWHMWDKNGEIVPL